MKFCHRCKSEKPEREMKTGRRCIDCHLSAKREYQRRCVSIRGKLGHESPLYYHGVGSRLLNDSEWQRLALVNRFIRTPWQNMGEIA